MTLLIKRLTTLLALGLVVASLAATPIAAAQESSAGGTGSDVAATIEDVAPTDAPATEADLYARATAATEHQAIGFVNGVLAWGTTLDRAYSKSLAAYQPYQPFTADEIKNLANFRDGVAYTRGQYAGIHPPTDFVLAHRFFLRYLDAGTLLADHELRPLLIYPRVLQAGDLTQDYLDLSGALRQNIADASTAWKTERATAGEPVE
jgi:hypothetical protein